MTLCDLANREPIPELPPASERVKLRKSRGVTQQQLADYLKVTRQTIVAWERGSSEPTAENRQKYVDLLRIWMGEKS